MWDPEEASPDFQEALYGESSDEDEGDDDIILEISDEEEFEDAADRDAWMPSTYSSISVRGSPEPYRDRGRDRSRSPICEPNVPIRVLDSREVVDVVYGEDFYAADSHALYESAEIVNVEYDPLNASPDLIGKGNSRERSVRGRGKRGERERGRRQQNRGRGGGRSCNAPGWHPGQPLQEIWLTDEDVPPELREMARDVLRRRQARVNEIEARRIARRINESARVEEESENDDVFEDATDGRGNTTLEGVDLHFEWSPMETFRCVEETFIPERTGSVSSYSNPYDAFRSYWDDGILQTIVDETNRNASRIKSASFQSEWYPTNAHELLCLFAFWMMAGIIRMPTIGSYFSNNCLLKTDVFSRITTLKRYTNLHRALLFVGSNPNSANPTNSDAASSDSMHCLRPIIDHLNTKFQSNYVLSKDVCIDENLTLWKGKPKFKQYIRSKAAKFGIKTVELCESATGYLWSFLVYTGKQDSLDLGVAKSTAVVLKLIDPILNKGYRLFMDGWYNSPLLARFLKRNRTDCVGTLRASREDVPRLVTHAPLQPGQLVARHSGDVCVLSWWDKDRINMISTCHGSATALSRVSSRPPSRPEPFKPQSILDYNRSMGVIDLKSQMLEPYQLERKRCTKWHLKFFKRLLNSSIQNSRILFESCLNAKQDNLKFRLELVHAILCHHHSHIPLSRRARSSHAKTAEYPHIVRHKHWPVRVPQTERDRTGNRNSRNRCAVCTREGRKTQKTPYMCEDCRVPLCVEYCFKKYHSVV